MCAADRWNILVYFGILTTYRVWKNAPKSLNNKYTWVYYGKSIDGNQHNKTYKEDKGKAAQA